MLFNSVDFLIFFPVVTILYFLLPHKFRWMMLLFASCIFYMFFIPAYIIILFITIIIDYFAGILIERTEKHKKKYLIISIISTCSVLFVFKYANFFNSNFLAIAEFFHLKYPIQTLNIILPIGLSFHTFQSLSYVIEVYRGNHKAEHHFGIYSLYVMFYPQLVAGPIERPQNLLHQFYEKHKFEYERVVAGLRQMLWGFFKKIVIADTCAMYADQIFNNYDSLRASALVLGAIYFAFQIYCDFSGYSDIAIGAAKVMGFNLMQNFAYPYFSRNIGEFWQRWHISLSTWFRDYVYIPLGGNRSGKLIQTRNSILTFTISGFWHGANWTYLIWGLLNGLYYLPSILLGKKRIINKEYSKSNKPVFRDLPKILLTFSITLLAWVFFRAKDLPTALSFIGSIFSQSLFMTPPFLFAFPWIVLLVIIEWIQRSKKHALEIEGLPKWIRWGSYMIIINLIFIFGNFELRQFIYFQF